MGIPKAKTLSVLAIRWNTPALPPSPPEDRRREERYEGSPHQEFLEGRKKDF